MATQMKKAEITIGGITYTHYGTPEAIEASRKRLQESMTVKANEIEKAKNRELYAVRHPITNAMIEQAKDIYVRSKQLQIGRVALLQELRETFNCGKERACDLIKEVRKKYGSSRAIKYWSDQ